MIEALIHQIDQLPAAEAQIKVFTIVNGDATTLASMLQTLFATQMTPGTPQGATAMPQTSASGVGTSLVPLRFAVDTRTNSIIACGTVGDLTVVEAILTRLDDSVRNRKNVVIRLKNSPAATVAQRDQPVPPEPAATRAEHAGRDQRLRADSSGKWWSCPSRSATAWSSAPRRGSSTR